MGVDWSAKAIIGVKINNCNITQKVRGCEHPQNGDDIFCGKCGKEMWKIEVSLNPIIEECQNDKTLSVCEDGEANLFIGKYYNSTGSNRINCEPQMIKLPEYSLDISKIKQDLKDKLKNLYKEENFGLWSILHCSY